MNNAIDADQRLRWLLKCGGHVNIHNNRTVSIKYPDGNEYSLGIQAEKWDTFKEVYKELNKHYPTVMSSPCILWAFDIVVFNQFIPDFLREQGEGGTESWHLALSAELF